jgi:hypothetical protein
MNTSKQLKIGLFINARDEENLKEWIVHHVLLGFNKIIIFDHKSIIPIKSLFQPLQKKVEIIDCNLEKEVKIKLMNEATKIAIKQKLDWFIYLDADEFIILNNINNIHDFIQLYKENDLIGLNWVMFGTNFHEKTPNGLIIENYTKVENKFLNKPIKSFVKTNQIINANNPHFYLMKNPNKMISIDYKILTKPYSFYENKLNFNEVSGYIAHYVHQSKETYIKRKINRPRDDTGTLRENNETKLLNIHRMFNNYDNLDPKHKYATKIKGFLKKNILFK